MIDIREYIQDDPAAPGLPRVRGATQPLGWPYEVKDLTNLLITKNYGLVKAEVLKIKQDGDSTTDQLFGLFWPPGYPYPFTVYFVSQTPFPVSFLRTLRQNRPLSVFTLEEPSFYPDEKLPRLAMWFWVNGLAVPLLIAGVRPGRGWLKVFQDEIVSQIRLYPSYARALDKVGFKRNTGLSAEHPTWVEFWDNRMSEGIWGKRLKRWPKNLFAHILPRRAPWPAERRKPGPAKRKGVFARETIEIQISENGLGSRSLEAWVYKGWAVHKRHEEHPEKRMAEYGWRLTHTGSGFGFVRLQMNQTAALAVARKMADKWGDISGLSKDQLCALGKKGLTADLIKLMETPAVAIA